MATFRYSAAVVAALAALACSPQNAQEAAAPAPAVASLAREAIEHVVPRPDFVGPLPPRFEWTAAEGVDEYAITIENEVDVLMFQARTRGTVLEWPKGGTLDPGTYFWRVVGTTGGRRVADSGRAAFVVTGHPQ